MSLHPILQIADRALSRDEDGKLVMDEKGAFLLELMILEHAADPALADALRGLFALGLRLESELDSPEAALALTVVLGKVQPALRNLAPDIEQAMERRAELLGSTERKADVEKLTGPPPEGAVSVRTLNIPEVPRPTRARPRR